MKKILALLLCAAVMVSITACGSSTETNATANTNSTKTTAVSATNGETAETVAPTADEPVENVKSEYKVGETWVVDGQWELTVTGVSETADRNEYLEKDPAAVYIVDFTWKNVGYVDENGLMDGLFLVLDDTIVDSQGLMGYSYPGEITDYPQETPVGASCNGQVCIGVDNAGLPITIHVLQYDGNGIEQSAIFIVE